MKYIFYFLNCILIEKPMNIEKELQEVGLQEKEAKVYIAMLELGRATAQDIARKAEVNRATTYFVIDNLMKKGLASAIDEGTKQYFLPEDPSRIVDIFERKQREFEDQRVRVAALVEELSAVSVVKMKKPFVKYYVGKEGILRMTHTSFKRAKGEKIYSVFSKIELDKYISKEDLSKERGFRVRNKMQAVALMNAVDKPVVEEGDTILVIPANEYDFPGDITFYKDNVVQLISYDDMTGVVIENKNIARTLRSLFSMALEYAKGKYTREI